jgi:hypothetical protein
MDINSGDIVAHQPDINEQTGIFQAVTHQDAPNINAPQNPMNQPAIDRLSAVTSIIVIVNGVEYNFCGQFIDGYFVNGCIKSEHEVMSGIFNKKLQLNGTNCKFESKMCTRIGTFIDGLFTNGRIYTRGKITEEGDFNGYELIKGTKYQFNGTKIMGTFKHNKLETGTILFHDGTIHQGTFDFHNKLLDGIVKTKNGFTAKVNYTPQRLLNKCFVNYSGDINELSPSQLKMYCCSSENCSIALNVFDKYLSNLSVSILMMMVESNFVKSTNITEQLGLAIITNNLKLAKEKKPMTHIPEDCIVDSLISTTQQIRPQQQPIVNIDHIDLDTNDKIARHQ